MNILSKIARIGPVSGFLSQLSIIVALTVVSVSAQMPDGLEIMLEDYRTFWGINSLTSKGDIVSSFGQPDEINSRRGLTFYQYYDGFLTIRIEKDSDMVAGLTLDFTYRKEPLPPVVPADIIQKSFLGQYQGDVIMNFGLADDRFNQKQAAKGGYDFFRSRPSEDYDYWLETGDLTQQITFSCYARRNYECRKFSINWWRR